MPRTNRHPLNCRACVIDYDLELCDPVAHAVVKAATSNIVADQRKAICKSGDICRAFAIINKNELGRGIQTMQINYRGRLKALRESLENAGETRLDSSVHTILVVGYYLQGLPQSFGLPSIIKKWENEPISWKHWLELSPICRCDVAEYPLPNPIAVAKPPRPKYLLVDPFVDPQEHEVYCTENELIDSILDNYHRFDHCLARIVKDSLTPRQVCLQRDRLIDELPQFVSRFLYRPGS